MAKKKQTDSALPSNVLEYNGVFVKFALAEFGYKRRSHKAQDLVDEFEAASDEEKPNTLLAQLLADLCQSSPVTSVIFKEVTPPQSKTKKEA